MPTELINLLVQIPIVAVFIWYSDRIYKQFMSFIIEQRKEDRQVIANLISEVKKVADCMVDTQKDHAVMLNHFDKKF